MSRRFINKCNRVARLSTELSQEMNDLREMFVARYGIDWNDADVDWLIDCFDYGQGGVQCLAEVDGHMKEAGYPVII